MQLWRAAEVGLVLELPAQSPNKLIEEEGSLGKCLEDYPPAWLAPVTLVDVLLYLVV